MKPQLAGGEFWVLNIRGVGSGWTVPVKASGSMSTHSIVSPVSPTAKMRSTSLALYVWDLEEKNLDVNQAL